MIQPYSVIDNIAAMWSYESDHQARIGHLKEAILDTQSSQAIPLGWLAKISLNVVSYRP